MATKKTTKKTTTKKNNGKQKYTIRKFVETSKKELQKQDNSEVVKEAVKEIRGETYVNTEAKVTSEPTTEKKKDKTELLRAFKFFLFSISAGVIQLLVTTLVGLSSLPASATYLIALVCSVLWNFTFNRKFTFKAANNVPKAMALAFLFYVFFAPASTVLTAYLTNGDCLGLFRLPTYLGILGSGEVAPGGDISLAATVVSTVACMIPNLILEFLWQKFVVFRGSIDTNAKANKK